MIKTNQFSANHSTIQNEPFKLPKFSKAKDSSLNINSMLVNKINKIVSIDGIREKSSKRQSLFHEPKYKVFERANEAIENIYSNQQHLHISSIQESIKSKLRLKKYENLIKANLASSSPYLSSKTADFQESIYKNIKSQQEMSEIVEK